MEDVALAPLAEVGNFPPWGASTSLALVAADVVPLILQKLQLCESEFFLKQPQIHLAYSSQYMAFMPVYIKEENIFITNNWV